MERDLNLEFRRLDESVGRTGEQAAEQYAKAGRISGRADLGDGSISVEVAPGGQLTDVRLSPAALNRGPQALAQQIFDLAQRATQHAGAAMHAALSPVLGADGQQHLASLGYEPADDEQGDTQAGFDGTASWRR